MVSNSKKMLHGVLWTSMETAIVGSASVHLAQPAWGQNMKENIAYVLHDTKDNQVDILCINALNLQNNLLQKFKAVHNMISDYVFLRDSGICVKRSLKVWKWHL